jgi:hypothetical protein
MKYDKAILCMFVKKQSVALKSVLRTTAGDSDFPSFSTDLFIIRDETTRQLITIPAVAIQKYYS